MHKVFSFVRFHVSENNCCTVIAYFQEIRNFTHRITIFTVVVVLPGFWFLLAKLIVPIVATYVTRAWLMWLLTHRETYESFLGREIFQKRFNFEIDFSVVKSILRHPLIQRIVKGNSIVCRNGSISRKYRPYKNSKYRFCIMNRRFPKVFYNMNKLWPCAAC